MLQIVFFACLLLGCQTADPSPEKASATPNQTLKEGDMMSESTPSPEESATPALGGEAPRVTAKDQNGDEVEFGALYEKGIVLVYFYPAADTPGCTAQACSLRDSYEVLTDRGVTVVGVSLDNQTDQKKFQEKYNLPFTLIADVDKKVVEAFGVSATGNYASREAFLVKDGKIVWHDNSASTSEQAKDVLEQLDNLG